MSLLPQLSSPRLPLHAALPPMRQCGWSATGMHPRRRFGERECVSQMVTEKSYVTGSFVALPLDGGLFGDKASYDLEVWRSLAIRIS